MSRLTVMFALIVCSLAANQAKADIVLIAGDQAGSEGNTGANFSGSLSVTSVDSNQAILTVTLLNTSNPVTVGGFLTAFVLNNPGNLVTSASLTSGLTGMMAFYFNNNDINASPFGDFDFGIGLTGVNQNAVFQGGGTPSNGIAPGSVGVFVIDLQGAGVGALTAADFVNATSSEGEFMAVRFLGLTQGRSDKVPGLTVNAVPEPASLALIGLGLPGLLAMRRKFARA